MRKFNQHLQDMAAGLLLIHGHLTPATARRMMQCQYQRDTGIPTRPGDSRRKRGAVLPHNAAAA